MARIRSGPIAAAILALGAAFIWATYYIIVLRGALGAGPACLVAFPFLAGGLAYLGLTTVQGHLRAFFALFRSPAAYLRIGLIVGMQVSILVATYETGAVDTSLLSLIADVVLTPLLIFVLFREGGARLRSWTLPLGMTLSLAGATLTIVGGGVVAPLRGVAILVAPIVPLTVAFYFLAVARTAREIPSSAIVAHATIGGAVAIFALSPLFPGGVMSLNLGDPTSVVWTIVLGVTSFFLAPFLYFRAIELGGLVLSALLMASIPVFTLGLSAAFLGITPTLASAAGVPIAVVGGILAIQGEHPPWTPNYEAPVE
ncbi:MAG: DMT family transporter [Thermoplasmata archaeon]